MRPSREEQETTVNMNRCDDKAKIYTSDSNMIRRFAKMAEQSEEWQLVDTQYCVGDVVSVTYLVPKYLVFFRKQKRTLSEEQRQKASERLKQYRKM